MEAIGVILCALLPLERMIANILLMWWHLARRLQLSPWESSIVNRLLTPTHSFLARSKSTAALSGDTGKFVEVQLSWWGKVFLLKHIWASNIHLTTSLFFPMCASLSSGWNGFGNVSVGVGFMPPALFLLSICLSILSGHQMPGSWKDAPPCDQRFQMLLSVHNITRKTYPFPAFLSAPASKQMTRGRNNLIH